jgi:hypothetical protein
MAANQHLKPPSKRAMREAAEQARKNEPLILWWMPVVALIGPIIAAFWFGATADEGALGEAAFALIWPGAPVYLITLAVLWGGWKIELE